MTDLVRVAGYRRALGASLARMFENALDWEHLPFVHAGSFRSIDLIDQRRDGWRADVELANGGELTLDLTLDRDAGRWTTDSFAGDRLIGRIVTDATADAPDGCRVDVAFFVPEAARGGTRWDTYYPALYDMLYDQDEALMIARAEAIARGPNALAERRDARLADGTPVSIPVYCPHQGLPLDAEPDADGVVTCPWHGYRFDAQTGVCISGAACGWAI